MKIKEVHDLDFSGHGGYFSVVDDFLNEVGTFDTYSEAEELLERLMSDYRDSEYRIYTWGVMGGLS